MIQPDTDRVRSPEAERAIHEAVQAARLALSDLVIADKLIALAHHDGAVNRVLELADIARPIQLREMRHRFAADAGDVAVFLGAEPGEEMPHQMRDILPACPQGWNGERQHVEPVE